MGGSAVFEILDDDGMIFDEIIVLFISKTVVRVSFDKSKYSYQEDAGSVSGVIVNLNTTIARDLVIDVTGGMQLYEHHCINIFIIPDPGSQLPTVDVSGTSITDTVTFQAYSNVLSQIVSDATIKNDATALETVEPYTYKLTNPSITDGVALGDDTQIEIIDDDGIFYIVIETFILIIVPNVSFGLPLYEYDEDDGDVTDIEIQLNTRILQEFTVTIAGGKYILVVLYVKLLSYSDPGKQPSTVDVSGFNVNGTVKFPANSVTGTKLKIPESFIEKQKFEIRNDTTALETLEKYNLSFTGSSVSAILGGPTQIQIKDDDGMLCCVDHNY